MKDGCILLVPIWIKTLKQSDEVIEMINQRSLLPISPTDTLLLTLPGRLPIAFVMLNFLFETPLLELW